VFKRHIIMVVQLHRLAVQYWLLIV